MPLRSSARKRICIAGVLVCGVASALASCGTFSGSSSNDGSNDGGAAFPDADQSSDATPADAGIVADGGHLLNDTFDNAGTACGGDWQTNGVALTVVNDGCYLDSGGCCRICATAVTSPTLDPQMLHILTITPGKFAGQVYMRVEDAAASETATGTLSMVSAIDGSATSSFIANTGQVGNDWVPVQAVGTSDPSASALDVFVYRKPVNVGDCILVDNITVDRTQ